MNERNELRGTLANTICNASNYPRRATPYLLGEDMSPVLDKTADAVLAAGYRRPRTITTVEELDALQIGSVVIDAHGDCFQRVEDADGKGAVVWAGDFMYASSSYLALPATVLHESEASK